MTDRTNDHSLMKDKQALHKQLAAIAETTRQLNEAHQALQKHLATIAEKTLELRHDREALRERLEQLEQGLRSAAERRLR